MKKMRRIHRLLAIGGVALLLTACGGGAISNGQGAGEADEGATSSALETDQNGKGTASGNAEAAEDESLETAQAVEL